MTAISADILLGLILKYGPTLAEEIAKIVRTADPTLTDWQDQIFSKLKSYEQLRDEAFARAGKTPTALPPA